MSLNSLLNRTFTPLDNNQSFTGVGESIKGHQAINVSIYADQNCVLTLMWSFNNIDFHFTSVHNITASVPFNMVSTNQGTYFKLRVENNSGSNMTILHAGCMFSQTFA